MNWKEGKEYIYELEGRKGYIYELEGREGYIYERKEGNGIYMSGLKIFEIYDMRPSFHGSKLLHTIWV